MNVYRVPTSPACRSHVRADWSPAVLIMTTPAGLPGVGRDRVSAESLRAFTTTYRRRRGAVVRPLAPGVYLDGVGVERLECCQRERAKGHAAWCPTPFRIV